ncbi:MAG: hypothetical protein RSG23_05005 [Gordonibacter sp.]|uniref:hypothetical protein n=1 Tax=Gordonibacter sp. TaxID=1968902 RepID=UPI002FC7B2D3
MIVSRASLCERCEKNDWRRGEFIREVFEDCGFDRPKSIWCASGDRPEDEQWGFCKDYIPIGGAPCRT